MKSFIILLALLLWESSIEAREIIITTSDETELFVKIEGVGMPLLYIHGGPGSGSHWFDELMGDFLEQHFTVIYLDQRGVGRSGKAKSDDYSLKRMVLDFEEVRQQLGFASWFTFGHSFGGILQMGYANQFPESIKGMVMVNCTINFSESACESWLPKAAELVGEKYTCVDDTVPVPQRMNELGGRLRGKKIFWKMGTRCESTFDQLNKISSEIPDFNYDFTRKVMNYPEYWNNFKPLTTKLEMPVLYYYGKKDFLVGPTHYKGVDFPNLMLWENRGGHIPFIEDKADLKKAILAYMAFYRYKTTTI